MLKTELEAQKTAQKALDDAATKLPKSAIKTPDELTKEFIEKNGTKEQNIKKAQDAFKDDMKKLFEGKRGGKFWGVVAGTAAAGALLAMAFRPNNKQA